VERLVRPISSYPVARRIASAASTATSGRALAQRPRLHAGLAEAAAARAAAHDLDLGAVEDDADVRHELADAVDVGLEVGGDAAGDRGRSGVVEAIQAVEAAVGR
jgi:hypothetical protein